MYVGNRSKFLTYIYVHYRLILHSWSAWYAPTNIILQSLCLTGLPSIEKLPEIQKLAQFRLQPGLKELQIQLTQAHWK